MESYHGKNRTKSDTLSSYGPKNWYTVRMKTISWIGTVTSIIGAYLVALQVILIGYIAFSIGSLTWLFVGFHRRDSALIVMNATFFVANLIGLYNATI